MIREWVSEWMCVCTRIACYLLHSIMRKWFKYGCILVKSEHALTTIVPYQMRNRKWHINIMLSHIHYNLDANEGFVGFIYFQVHCMVYRLFTCFRFHFRNEIPIDCLFTKGKWTRILSFGPSRRSAFDIMEFVNARPSKKQGWFFFFFFFINWAGLATVVGQDQKNKWKCDGVAQGCRITSPGLEAQNCKNMPLVISLFNLPLAYWNAKLSSQVSQCATLYVIIMVFRPFANSVRGTRYHKWCSLGVRWKYILVLFVTRLGWRLYWIRKSALNNFPTVECWLAIWWFL